LKLNGANQLLVYADVVHILGGRANTLRKHIKSLLVDSKKIGLEVNSDKANDMVMSRDQNAGRSQNVKI